MNDADIVDHDATADGGAGPGAGSDRDEVGGARRHDQTGRDTGMLISVAVAVLTGAAFVLTARAGAVPLLVAIAAVQLVLAVAWVVGFQPPGRIGALGIAAVAAAGTDVAVSLFPHGRLGASVAVLGLAVPVMFVHQLARGVARVSIVASLSGIALLVLAVVALPALAQLRHELETPAQAGRVVAAAVGAIAVASVVGFLVDLVLPRPRFDPDVPRGLPAVVVSAAAATAVTFVLLRGDAGGAQFTGGRAAFVGAVLGALAALLSVGATFLDVSMPGTGRPVSTLRAGLRRAVVALLPLCLLAPVAFLLCLAVRS